MRTRLTLAIIVGLLCCVSALAYDPPRVTKIDPPNWWTSFTPELMLLITGEHLSNAKISVTYPGVSVARTQAGASDHYLFVWLKLDPTVRAGRIPFTIQSSAGQANITLPIFERKKDFTPAGISSSDVIYLIMPDRFADGDPANDRPTDSTGVYDRSQPMAYHGGDLKGIHDHLSYLRDLGVSTLWLTPVWKNTNSDYHGYHVVDFYAVDEHMGSLAEYQELVAAAHQIGMKVLIDYVVNHTGPSSPWANDPPLVGWLHGTPQNHLPPEYNFNGLVDPHASLSSYQNVLEGWFVDKLPDLNPDNPLVSEYVTENALWWTEIAGLDGFRLDTFPYSSRSFWSTWHKGMRSVFPDLYSLGEVADGNPAITSFFQGGRTQFDGVDSGVTTVFDFPLHRALRDVLDHNAPMQRVTDIFRQDSLYPRYDRLVTFIGNHDGTRILRDAGGAKEKVKAAFTLLLTMRGVPEIYSGDEIAMDGGDDPDNRRDFPGGFPGDSQNAFTPAGRTPDQQEIYDHVRSLLHLRQDHPALSHGLQKNIGSTDNAYAYVRETSSERMLVIWNNGGQSDLAFPLKGTSLETAKTLNCILGGGQARIEAAELKASVPSDSVTVCRAD